MADIKVGILEKDGVEYNNGPVEYRLQAEDVVFNPSGTTYRSTTDEVFKALQELRKKIISSPESTASTLNGTLSLLNTSNSFQVVTGTADGFKVDLPDATTTPVGSSFEIFNNSTKGIVVRNGAGTPLVTINSGSLGTFKLESAPNAAGSWIFVITTTTIAGITSFVLTSSTTFTTSSTTDDLITGFSVLPVSGRYSVFFSAESEIVGNNRVAAYVVYAGGVAVENTRRIIQGVGSKFKTTMQTIGEINVDGTENVDVRVNIDSNSLQVKQRSLVLIRLGSTV